MKIAYVTSDNPNEVRNRSGVAVFMSAAFERIGHTVERIGPLREAAAGPSLAKRQLYKALGPALPARSRPDRGCAATRDRSSAGSRRATGDVVISPGSIPIVVRADRQADGVLGRRVVRGDGRVLPQSSATSRRARSVRAMRRKQAALSGCTLAIYASEWARQGALANYEVGSRKGARRSARREHRPRADA